MALHRAFGLATSTLLVALVTQVVVPTGANSPHMGDLTASQIAGSSTSAPAPTLGEVVPPSQPISPEYLPLVLGAVDSEAAALASRTTAGVVVGTVPTTSIARLPADSVPVSVNPPVVLAKPVEVGSMTTDPPGRGIAPAVRDESAEDDDVSVLELPSLLEASRALDRALVVEAVPNDPFACHDRAAELPLVDDAGAYDRNLIAQMTHTVFACVAAVAGMNTEQPSWTGGGRWEFEHLAEQVAAEAAVVSYCESVGYQRFALEGNNAWGYGGLFQMGSREMRTYGFRGASKFDPVDNAYAAATYFVRASRRGGRWAGWGPWAVVNTDYNDEVNDQVKVPVLPRFRSTDPDYGGRRGAELPEWAVDPWTYRVPAWQGCPITGRAWPASTLLDA